MPRYFFNLRHGTRVMPDPEGTEFSDLAAAMSYARDAAREMMGERLKHGIKINGSLFEITDEKGAVLGTQTFKDALP